MSEPLVVMLPHRLGKDEALRRLKDGLGRAKTEFAWLIALEGEVWSGDRLSFRAAALGQRAAGFIDVYDHAVRLEVTLPLAAGALCPRAAARDRAEGAIDAGEEVTPGIQNCPYVYLDSGSGSSDRPGMIEN